MTQTRSDYYQKLQEQNIPRGPANITTGHFAKASGATMNNLEGKEYIDFAGGIGVNNVGHAHPKVVAAIKDQAEKLIHSCFHVGMYPSYIDLAARLNEIVPGDFPKMTLFANSGAEAVENAVKVARYARIMQGRFLHPSMIMVADRRVLNSIIC